MRIGIDARLMHSAGVGRYIRGLVGALADCAGDDEIVLFLRRKDLERFVAPAPHIRAVLAEAPSYSWREQVALPFVFRRERLDLLHVPHFNIPWMYSGPLVVTLHDLTHSAFPNPLSFTSPGAFYRGVRQRVYGRLLRRAARTARHVLTDSNYVKGELERELGVPAERITVTYAAPAVLPEASEPVEEITFRLGIVRPFILYVGSFYRHKNVSGLLRALKTMRSHDVDVRLVLAGKLDKFGQALQAEAKELELGNRVLFPGFVTDAELRALYETALAFVFPSLSEGFGLPPLEAMAHHLPVIASNATCLPEVLGDAAAFADAANPEDLARAIEQVVGDAAYREELRRRGTTLVSRYSWARLGEQTLAVYHAAVEGEAGARGKRERGQVVA